MSGQGLNHPASDQMRQSMVRGTRNNHWSASGQVSSLTESAPSEARLCDAHTLSTASPPFNTGFVHKTASPPLDEQAVPPVDAHLRTVLCQSRHVSKSAASYLTAGGLRFDADTRISAEDSTMIARIEAAMHGVRVARTGPLTVPLFPIRLGR